MKSLHNIDKSAFYPNTYIGYADGTWRIRRTGRKLWQATHIQDGDAPVLTAPRLTDISDLLDAYAKIINNDLKVVQ